MTPVEFTAALQALLGELGSVVQFGFNQITEVFDVVVETPLLLIPVGFSIMGIVVKFGKKFIKL